MFDFLKRREAPPKEWKTGRIEFLGEQRGPAEEAFTSALAARFAADPRIQRAYLARVRYATVGPQRGKQENRGPSGADAPVEVLLCLAAPEDVGIVALVAEEFRKLFATSQHMDTLFLTGDHERELTKVAAPFYRSAR